MKKNKSMRAAGGLMIATLLSTSIVSGTYAKYVTSDSASDTARVAKFGVEVKASGTLFDTTYKYVTDGNVPGAGETNVAKLTVQSSNSDKLVAPGTKNEKGITFVISGKPEVDVELNIAVGDTLEEVFLKEKQDLPDMTTGNATDKFDNTANYYPVKFTLTQSTKTDPLVDGGTLEQVKTTLTGLTARYDANTDLSKAVGTLNLTWEWDFDDSKNGTYDKQDTLLGDLAAGTALTPSVTLEDGTDYNLDEKIEIAISVTQID